jgi:hypothetical protein
MHRIPEVGNTEPNKNRVAGTDTNKIKTTSPFQNVHNELGILEHSKLRKNGGNLTDDQKKRVKA